MTIRNACVSEFPFASICFINCSYAKVDKFPPTRCPSYIRIPSFIFLSLFQQQRAALIT